MSIKTFEQDFQSAPFTINGGNGKAIYTNTVSGRDYTVVLTLGALPAPFYISSTAESNKLELQKGAVSTSNDGFLASEFLAGKGIVTSDQTLAADSAVATATEGALAAEATADTQRIILFGTGKATIERNDKTYSLALDELSYPFIYSGALEVEPGSLVQHITVANGTTSADVNNIGQVYDSATDEHSEALIHAGQGVVTLENTANDISDNNLRLNTLGYPFQVGTQEDIVIGGTAILFGSTEETVA